MFRNAAVHSSYWRHSVHRPSLQSHKVQHKCGAESSAHFHQHSSSKDRFWSCWSLMEFAGSPKIFPLVWTTSAGLRPCSEFYIEWSPLPLKAKHILGFQKQRNGKPDQKRHYLIDLFKWAGTNTIRDGLALGSGGLNILTRFVTVGRTLLLVFSFLVSSFRVASFQIFFRSQLIFQWLCCPDFPTELCSYFKSIRLIRKINEPEL